MRPLVNKEPHSPSLAMQLSACWLLTVLYCDKHVPIVIKLTTGSSGVASWWARAPLAFGNFFSLQYTLKQVVLFGLVLCQTLNLALFVQPYSLWNDAMGMPCHNTVTTMCVCKS